MLSTVYTVVVLALVVAIVAVTVLPIFHFRDWWIRAWDFPRVQILAVAVAVGVLALFLDGAPRWVALAAVAACAGYHAWYIHPFTTLARPEIRLAPAGDDQVALLASNVLMENQDASRIADLIEREQPDAVFLMETDQAWVDRLQPVLERFETVVAEPLDNYYGLVFATNLTVDEARVVYISGNHTPTLFAKLRDREGRPFRFIGLHPRPPVPGEDTHERDAKIAYAARYARNTETPVVIMGDFNEAAWSHMAHEFKRIGGYLDPRVGRGMIASFDANSRIMRFPIDQLYITREVALVNFRRGPHIGSDHFPMIARVRLDRDLAYRLNSEPLPLSDADQAEVAELIAKHGQVEGVDPMPGH